MVTMSMLYDHKIRNQHLNPLKNLINLRPCQVIRIRRMGTNTAGSLGALWTLKILRSRYLLPGEKVDARRGSGCQKDASRGSQLRVSP